MKRSQQINEDSILRRAFPSHPNKHNYLIDSSAFNCMYLELTTLVQAQLFFLLFCLPLTNLHLNTIAVSSLLKHKSDSFPHVIEITPVISRLRIKSLWVQEPCRITSPLPHTYCCFWFSLLPWTLLHCYYRFSTIWLVNSIKYHTVIKIPHLQNVAKRC